MYGRVQSCLARPCRTPPSTSLRLTPLHAPTYPATCFQVCYALSQLASGFYEQRGTSPMSPYFKDVVQALLETVRRKGAGERGQLLVARLCWRQGCVAHCAAGCTVALLAAPLNQPYKYAKRRAPVPQDLPPDWVCLTTTPLRWAPRPVCRRRGQRILLSRRGCRRRPLRPSMRCRGAARWLSLYLTL